jgi:uncharacterized protein YdbL (DUF1318 family)
LYAFQSGTIGTRGNSLNIEGVKNKLIAKAQGLVGEKEASYLVVTKDDFIISKFDLSKKGV